MKVAAGDTLETGAGGRLRVQLEYGPIVSLGTQARLDVLDSNRISLGFGRMRVAGVRSTRGRLEIRAHLAKVSLTSRSGDFIVDDSNPVRTVVISGGAKLAVQRGKVIAWLGPGEMTTVNDDGPSPAKPAEAVEKQKW